MNRLGGRPQEPRKVFAKQMRESIQLHEALLNLDIEIPVFPPNTYGDTDPLPLLNVVSLLKRFPSGAVFLECYDALLPLRMQARLGNQKTSDWVIPARIDPHLDALASYAHAAEQLQKEMHQSPEKTELYEQALVDSIARCVSAVSENTLGMLNSATSVITQPMNALSR